MSDLSHLIATKQYYAAAWRVIDARPDLSERTPLDQVDEIVLKAIENRVDGELQKIVRTFKPFIGKDAADMAAMYLAETTQVDLHPDERDEL